MSRSKLSIDQSDLLRRVQRPSSWSGAVHSLAGSVSLDVSYPFISPDAHGMGLACAHVTESQPVTQ